MTRSLRRIALVAACLAMLDVTTPSRAQPRATASFDLGVGSPQSGVDVDDAAMRHGIVAAAIRTKSPAPAIHLASSAWRSAIRPFFPAVCGTPSPIPRHDPVPLYDLHRVYRV